MNAAFVSLFALSLMAQDSLPRATEKSRTIATGQDAVVDYYDSLSDYFRQSQRAIQAINKKGIPDQEIPAVLLIARRSSASPNEVIDARKSGKEWADLAKQHKVNLGGQDFVQEANLIFLSEYHGRPLEQIRALHSKGSSFIAINQEYRRSGKPMPRATEKQR